MAATQPLIVLRDSPHLGMPFDTMPHPHRLEATQLPVMGTTRAPGRKTSARAAHCGPRSQPRPAADRLMAPPAPRWEAPVSLDPSRKPRVWGRSAELAGIPAGPPHQSVGRPRSCPRDIFPLGAYRLRHDP